MEVIFIRHTRVDVPKGICYGQTDVPLAPTFEEEAAATLALLKTYGAIDQAFTSPLKRAVKLADYCGFSHATRDDRLKEMNMGLWEMQRYDEIDDPYLQQWYDDYLHLPTPQGESFPMQRERVASFLDELRTKSFRRVAVFAHAGVLACAALYAHQYEEKDVWSHVTNYGGIMALNLL